MVVASPPGGCVGGGRLSAAPGASGAARQRPLRPACRSRSLSLSLSLSLSPSLFLTRNTHPPHTQTPAQLEKPDLEMAKAEIMDAV